MTNLKRNIRYYFCTDCNLNCKYCNIVETSDTSSMSSIDEVLRSIESNKDNIGNIIIFGGEPLQLKYKERLIYELFLISNAKSDNTTISMITNGYDVDIKSKIDLVNDLVEIYPDLKITTSWDGFNSKAKEGFIISISKNLDRINYVINNNNYNTFYDDILYMENILKDLPNRWKRIPQVEFVFSVERDTPKYFDHVDIIKDQLIKLYRHNPNYEKFSDEIKRLCNSKEFDGINKTKIIEISKGEVKDSCLDRYNYSLEDKALIRESLKICKTCEAQGCFVCPSRIGKLTLNNKELITDNYYCKINRIINEIKIQEKRRKIIFNKLKNSNKPALELMISTKCNMNCNYCKQGSHNSGKIMNKETIDNSINLIKELTDKVELVLFGGEVLMSSNIEILNYLLDKLKENNIKSNFTLVTNAYDMNDKILNILNRINIEQNLKQLQISLDGTKKIHDSNRVDLNGKGTFDKILNNIYKLNNIGIKNITTNSVLTFENLEYLPDYILFLEDIKRKGLIKNSSFNFDLNKRDEFILDELKYMEDIFYKICKLYEENKISIKLFKNLFRLNDLYSEYDSYGCSILNNIITLDPEGNIIPCHSSIDNYILGNINTNIYNENILEIINLISQPKEFHSDLDLCRECEAEPTCSKCKMHNLINYGSINNIPKSYCQLVKSRFKGLMRYTNGKDRFKLFTDKEREECLNDINQLKEIINDNEFKALSNDEALEISYQLQLLLKILKERS